MPKYIIIDAEVIEKRIEELENAISKCILPDQHHLKDLFEQELEIKTQILSESTPLIPEIEKSFDAGRIPKSKKVQGYGGKRLSKYLQKKKDYISNFKLDI